MPIERKVEEGDLFVYTVSGQLGVDEYRRALAGNELLAQRGGHIKLLVLLKDFEGWEKAKGWEDSATDHIDPYIKKFAIVGDNKWRDLVEVFTLKGLRPMPIEYFSEGTEELARAWLESD